MENRGQYDMLLNRNRSSQNCLITQSFWQRAGQTIFLLIVGALMTCSGKSTLAQSEIVPDRTLDGENSQVRTNVEVKGNPAEVIEGGAQRGANLFHSFSEFNVSEGRGAYFTNPSGIEHIFSRVTGSNPSEILGTLGVLGNADLFLINPNGIIFGENARLDVGGSFIGTTANGVKFGATGLFSASEPKNSNLLTVKPSALFFNQMATGEIINRSQAFGVGGETNSRNEPVGLQASSNQTLALLGGDVFLEGGNLTATGGRIEIGSIAGFGEVSLSQNGQSWKFEYDENNTFGNIRLQNGSIVDVSGSGGGDVQIQGNQFEMLGGSFLFADTLGSEDGGEVLIRTNEVVNLSDGSLLTVDVFGSGVGGDLSIETRQLTLQNGALISVSTFGEGDGGSLNINATNSVLAIGTTADGQFPSALFANTEGEGTAGNLNLETGQLIVQDGAQIGSGSFGLGNGGALSVNATESIQVIGESANGQIVSGLFTQTEGAGTASNLTIETSQLIVRDGAQISAGTRDSGNGGALTINATESVQVIGESANGQIRSGLFTQTQGEGAAGNLTIKTSQLIVRDGARISAGTRDSGNGGALSVNATESIQVIGESTNGQIASGLFTETQEAGAAGTLTLETGQLIVRDGAQIRAGTFGLGNGGALEINATESVQVIGTSKDNLLFPSSLSTETRGTGTAGDLTIETEQLTLTQILHLLCSLSVLLEKVIKGKGKRVLN